MLAKQQLIELIQSAWGNATLPDRDNISSPTYDDEGVSAYFAGKTWRGHAAAQLRRLDFAPNIFTEDAFAYYLPAYLIADLEDPETSDTNIERVLFWLSNDGQSLRHGPAVIARLNALQRAALRACVEFVWHRDGYLIDEECTTILRLLQEADKHV